MGLFIRFLFLSEERLLMSSLNDEGAYVDTECVCVMVMCQFKKNQVLFTKLVLIFRSEIFEVSFDCRSLGLLDENARSFFFHKHVKIKSFVYKKTFKLLRFNT
jgi:hypothetical protein